MAEKRSAQAQARKKSYDAAYVRDHYKRVPLQLKKSDYEKIRAAAEAAGETVSGYIRGAVLARAGEIRHEEQ